MMVDRREGCDVPAAVVTGTRLWPHQADAVRAVAEAIGRGGRTTVVAACGTGKTRIGAAVAAEVGPHRRLLVVLPTIELLVQTLRVYRDAGDGPLGVVLAVCSDPTVADVDLLSEEPGVVVTTTADVLAAGMPAHGRVTVLTTYASLPVISAAHADHGVPAWDLVIVDEAHRTTGKADGPWKAVHHDAMLPAIRRLYMTATPRVAVGDDDAVVSMDDTAIYGQVSFRLPFSRAIGMGLLADYRVVVPVVTDAEIHRLTGDETLSMQVGGLSVTPSVLAGQMAVLRTMIDYQVRRAISYHHRIADARLWATALPKAAQMFPGGPLPVWAAHVSGHQAAALRRRVIERLAEPGDSLAMVSNARVLNEGIDVPAVDAVVFSQPRTSAIDTIQAVGRALRTGGRSDKVATVVVPLLLSPGESPEAALQGSVWDPVWQVIRALRDHDDRLDDELRNLRRQVGEGRLVARGPREVTLPSWLKVQGVAVPAAFAEAITIRAVRSTTTSWDEYFGAARAFHHLHGHVNVPLDWVSPGGLRVGSWIGDQRKARKAGRLSADREAALAVLNMIWDMLEDAWDTGFGYARAYHETHGNLRVRQDWLSDDGYKLGRWLSWQRMAYRSGDLAAERVDALNALGMIWDTGMNAWQHGYVEARAYQREHGDLMVAHTWQASSGHRLGLWIGAQRRRYANGKLTAEQITALDELGMLWDPLSRQWQQGFEHACAYRERHGNLDVPRVWKDDSDGFALGTWIGNQRAAFRSGSLSPDRVKALLDLGIVWDVNAAKWERGHAAASEYRDHTKDLRVPADWVTASGFRLGGWIGDQRKARAAGTLASDRVDRLDKLGMSWRQPDDTWQLAYAALREFREQHGHLDITYDHITASGVNICNWMSTQRGRRSQGKLSAERIRLLDAIGFPWDTAEERWMRRYHEVAAAMGDHANPKRLPPGSPERIWLDNQRIAYRRNTLSPQRRILLEAIGGGTEDLLWAAWLSAYEELAAFYREEGHYRVPTEYLTVDGISLNSWKNVQRSRRNLGKLPNKHIAMLDRIDFPWDGYDEHWDQRYAEAVAYHQRHGHLNPPENSRLHKWILRQRRRIAAGTLSAQKLTLLRTLNDDWTS